MSAIGSVSFPTAPSWHRARTGPVVHGSAWPAGCLDEPVTNPQRIAEVMNLRYFNDHLVDRQLSNDPRDRTISDHAQLVAEIRLL